MPPFKKHATLLFPNKMDLAPLLPRAETAPPTFLLKTRANRTQSWRDDTDHKLRPRSLLLTSTEGEGGCNLALIHGYASRIEKTGIRKDQNPTLCTFVTGVDALKKGIKEMRVT